MTTTNTVTETRGQAQERARYEAVEAAKIAIHAQCVPGMSEAEFEAKIVPQIRAAVGKNSRGKLTDHCRKLAGLPGRDMYAIQQASARVFKTKGGSWASEVGGTASHLSRAECENRGLTPGSQNF